MQRHSNCNSNVGLVYVANKKECADGQAFGRTEECGFGGKLTEPLVSGQDEWCLNPDSEAVVSLGAEMMDTEPLGDTENVDEESEEEEPLGDTENVDEESEEEVVSLGAEMMDTDSTSGPVGNCFFLKEFETSKCANSEGWESHVFGADPFTIAPEEEVCLRPKVTKGYINIKEPNLHRLKLHVTATCKYTGNMVTAEPCDEHEGTYKLVGCSDEPPEEPKCTKPKKAGYIIQKEDSIWMNESFSVTAVCDHGDKTEKAEVSMCDEPEGEYKMNGCGKYVPCVGKDLTEKGGVDDPYPCNRLSDKGKDNCENHYITNSFNGFTTFQQCVYSARKPDMKYNCLTGDQCKDPSA